MYKWVNLLGNFSVEDEKIVFNGSIEEYSTTYGKQKGPAVGNIISDQFFSEGKIVAEINFVDTNELSRCEVIISYTSNPLTMLNAGIGGGDGAFTIRKFDGSNWIYYSQNGDKNFLKKDRNYTIEVNILGSRISLLVDGVITCQSDSIIQKGRSQVGLWTRNSDKIIINKFKIDPKPPNAFVIMQFSDPYNSLYCDVIKPVCNEFGIDAQRSDESFKPGLIIADVISNIIQSRIIIADISPVNANVYYELGYSHAMGKDSILIADKNTSLPFDISPFRTLFYENTIAGKKAVEDGLRKHLNSILIR